MMMIGLVKNPRNKNKLPFCSCFHFHFIFRSNQIIQQTGWLAFASCRLLKKQKCFFPSLHRFACFLLSLMHVLSVLTLMSISSFITKQSYKLIEAYNSFSQVIWVICRYKYMVKRERVVIFCWWLWYCYAALLANSQKKENALNKVCVASVQRKEREISRVKGGAQNCFWKTHYWSYLDTHTLSFPNSPPTKKHICFLSSSSHQHHQSRNEVMSRKSWVEEK